MKIKKQWRIGICAFFVVFLLAGVMKLTVFAENTNKKAITEDDIVIDYIYETMTVNTTEDEVIYYTNTYHSDLSRWDACEVRDGKAVFDISWVNEEKTVRLYLRGDVQTEVVSINLTWQENFRVKFTGTLLFTDITEVNEWRNTYAAYPNFSEDTGYLIFTLEENKRDNYYYDLENVEWRKGNDGAWRDFDELDLKEMNIRGIKLEFRIKAENELITNDDSGVSTASVLKDSGTRASSIARITINKLGTAPEIILDSDAMTIAVRNGHEFSLDKENWILIPNYSRKQGMDDYLVEEIERQNVISEIYTNQRISGLLIQEILGLEANTEMTAENLEFEDFDFELDKNGNKTGIIVYVRDVATEKKAASLIKEVVIPLFKTEQNLYAAKEQDFSITYGESKTGNGGIICNNISIGNQYYPAGIKYQMAIISPKEYAEYEAAGALPNNIDVSKIKWTVIKPGRTMKLTNKKIQEGSYILYRIAGEGDRLPSTYLISEEIRYDKITYAGISSFNQNVGDTLKAIVSTNASNAAQNVEYKWQRCSDVKAEVQVWEDITDAEGNVIDTSTYTLTEEDVDYYIRVVISNDVNEKASEPIGPVTPAN